MEWKKYKLFKVYLMYIKSEYIKRPLANKYLWKHKQQDNKKMSSVYFICRKSLSQANQDG